MRGNYGITTTDPMHTIDNITGPDPREDDPTLREGTLHIMLTASTFILTSNRDSAAYAYRRIEELINALENEGFNVNVTQHSLDIS